MKIAHLAVFTNGDPRPALGTGLKERAKVGFLIAKVEKLFQSSAFLDNYRDAFRNILSSYFLFFGIMTIRRKTSFIFMTIMLIYI